MRLRGRAVRGAVRELGTVSVSGRSLMADAQASELANVARDLEALAARVAELAACADAPGAEPEDGGSCKLLKVCEVVKRTGLSRGAVYALARKGQAGAIRTGERSIRFDERGLAEWQRNGGAS